MKKTEPQNNWVKVLDHAPWRERDSQGRCVYKDQMWILGGWFGSYEAAPRDVWCSPNGKDWTLVQDNAPWIHSDLPMSTVFKNKMWMMGGWYNGRLPDHSAGNEVWSTNDGDQWQQVTDHAGWTPRLAAGVAIFKNKMWILGGIENYLFGDDNSLKNDVWCSSDGNHWELATRHAGWSPRAFHQTVVFDNKMWVLGGGSYMPNHHACNDVWCSEDGMNWTQVIEAAPWEPRLWFSSVIYRNRIWVLGGWSKNYDNFGDVWHSKEGKTWTQLKSDIIWKPRHEHSAYVFNDKIWIAGGLPRPLSNEVWSLEIAEDWLTD